MPEQSRQREPSVRAMSLAGVAGFVVGLIGLILLVDRIRAWGGLPMPNPVPLSDRADKSFGPTYWVPWLIAWAMVLCPGIVLIVARRTRRAGWAYVIVVILVGGLVTLVFAPFDWFGLAPT